MNTNHNFRLGYIDADAYFRLNNRLPSAVNLALLFKVKGEDYQKGFEKRIATRSRKAEAS